MLRKQKLMVLFLGGFLAGGHLWGEAVLRVSGTQGVIELGRAEMAFNFQDGGPGVDGLPFRMNAYGAHGMIYNGSEAPVLSESDGAIMADYGGKFSVGVQWTKGSGEAGNRVYADVTIVN